MVKSKLMSLYEPPNKEGWRGERRFTIPGVFYGGEAGTYSVFEENFPKMSFDELSETSEQERLNGNPHAVDSVLHFAIMDAAYRSRHVEGIFGFLQTSHQYRRFTDFIRQKLDEGLVTLTSIQYSLEGDEGIVVHNPDSENQLVLRGNFFDEDFFSFDWHRRYEEQVFSGERNEKYFKDKDRLKKRILEPYFGTSNRRKIKKVFGEFTHEGVWFNGPDQEEPVKRVVSFERENGNIHIGSFLRLSSDHYPALRVLRIE